MEVFRLGLVVVLLGLGMIYSERAGKLTAAAAGTGGALGLLIYLGSGFAGLALLALFFGLGTAASSWRVADKRRLGLAEENKGRRTAGQVVANAGVAGLLGLLAWQYLPAAPLAQLMLAGSLAAATADTLSSELGNVYGRRYYNILTLRPDIRGLNGVVSLEGTALGLAGTAVLAAAYCLGFGAEWAAFGWLLVAGTAGNLADSVLGATVERRGWLGNNAVNFLNTLTGALVAGGLGWWLG
ncbi:DUF92 domain-containing protein [Hymenobacter artigasi]|uniref:Uncharacterized protein (TIGR00297 family) n=1 Tax=Hymenobacter artigasi TaxID=2719616 RepID=A0ABX1HME2_9BACT|nr:DUF92 domain-containing protein [Hymenobacter artigasi]NKI91419.1 uncharacterized protein (TIGR00297 family) [Hymenobacter artigasi]